MCVANAALFATFTPIRPVPSPPSTSRCEIALAFGLQGTLAAPGVAKAAGWMVGGEEGSFAPLAAPKPRGFSCDAKT